MIQVYHENSSQKITKKRGVNHTHSDIEDHMKEFYARGGKVTVVDHGSTGDQILTRKQIHAKKMKQINEAKK